LDGDGLMDYEDWSDEEFLEVFDTPCDDFPNGVRDGSASFDHSMAWLRAAVEHWKHTEFTRYQNQFECGCTACCAVRCVAMRFCAVWSGPWC
jgi:hypothetical protein